jgi:hypothetical protein
MWAILDMNNTGSDFQRFEELTGVGTLALVCPEHEASPAVGATHACDTTSSLSHVLIQRFAHLDDRPQFASTRNQSITMPAFLTFYLNFLENAAPSEDIEFSNVQVVNETDATVNVKSAQTNQTVATLPAKIVENTMTLGGIFRLSLVSLVVLNGTTGYSMSYFIDPSLMEGERQLPNGVRQIFDSFELIE